MEPCASSQVLPGESALRSRARNITTSNICSAKDLICSARVKRNEVGVKMGEEQSWEDDNKRPAYKPEQSNETLQDSSHSEVTEESQRSDSKQCAVDETIKMMAVELCVLRKS